MVCRLMRWRSVQDYLGSAQVDVGGREVIDTLMMADVVVVLDEGADLPFEVASQIIAVEAGYGSPRRFSIQS